jgi:peptide/nickel transport system substrate-binding protein
MNKKKVISLVLAAAMSISAFSSIGTTALAAETTQTLYTNSGPLEFFVHPWLNPGQYMTQKVIWDSLIGCDADMNPTTGRLAESYELSEDGLTLTFVMRDGVKWHDGEDITTEDVKWSIEYSLNTGVLNSVFADTFKAIEGCDAYLAGEADEISGIEITDDTIVIHFASVAQDALLTFSQFVPLPKHCLEDTDPMQMQQSSYFQNPVGSGPFKVAEVEMGSYCVLEPYEDYWGGVADFNIQCSASSAEADENLVTNALAGQVDYAYTKTYTDAQALMESDEVTVDTVDVKYTRLFWVNKFAKEDGSESPLADVRVRQAIAYAIDMDAICEGIFDGATLPADAMAPNSDSKAEGLESYSYDPDKAKELLDEAGWDSSTVLKVVYYYTDQQTVDLMAVIQQQLAAVGIQMEASLITGDTDTILWSKPDDVVNGPSAVDWDMAYAAVAAMSLSEYYGRLSSTAAINSHTPYDEELQALIDATNTADPEAQTAAYQALETYENENLIEIPLYYQPVWVVSSSKIAGNVEKWGNPQFRWDWEIQNWTLAE